MQPQVPKAAEKKDEKASETERMPPELCPPARVPKAAAKNDEKASKPEKIQGTQCMLRQPSKAVANNAAGRANNAAGRADGVPTGGLKEAIKQAREDNGFSMAELAKMINKKLRDIQSYESGEAIPNDQIIEELERALTCKLRCKK